MRPARALIALLAAAALFAPAAHAFEMEAVERGIVRLINVQNGRPASTGTGFSIDANHLLTNRHVVAGADRVLVAAPAFSEALEARVVATHRDFDLAILRLRAPELEPLALAGRVPEPGSSVFAVGYPGKADTTGVSLKDPPTVTGGVFSRVYRQPWKPGRKTIETLQHNADISGGNSGGPLLDACNRVIGVNTAIIGRADQRGNIAQGLFWASSIQYALALLRDNGIDIEPVTTPCRTGGAEAEAARTAAEQAMRDNRALRNSVLRWGGIALVAVAALLLLVFVVTSAMLRRQDENMRAAMKRVAEPVSRTFRRGGGRVTRPADDAAGTPADSRPQRAGRTRPGGSGLALTGIGPDGTPLRILLPVDELARAGDGHCLGRHPELVDTVIADDSVSRRHARVTSDGRGLHVEDLNSTRGTTVNGARLEPFTAVPLKAGDKLSLGRVELVASSL